MVLKGEIAVGDTDLSCPPRIFAMRRGKIERGEKGKTRSSSIEEGGVCEIQCKCPLGGTLAPRKETFSCTSGRKGEKGSNL